MGRQKFSDEGIYAFLMTMTLYSSKSFRRKSLVGCESPNAVLASFQKTRDVVGGTPRPNAVQARSLPPGSLQ
jgi:hypothetical protein